MSEEFDAFVDGYLTDFASATHALDRSALTRIRDVLVRLRGNGGCLLIAGNGGSAAIANHAECDVTKGAASSGLPPIRSRSLVANPSLLTAIANDMDYSVTFAKQIELYARPGDAVLLVSSSGNSANMVAACTAAKERGLPTIALVGFSGGTLKEMADVVLHVPVHNYGIVEDLHQAVLHVVTQYLRSHH